MHLLKRTTTKEAIIDRDRRLTMRHVIEEDFIFPPEAAREQNRRDCENWLADIARLSFENRAQIAA
jgi:hypothetical protein